MHRLRHRRLAAAGLGAFLIVFALASASAVLDNISHSYNAVGNIMNGSIVSLDPNRSNYVQLANIDNGSRLVGVALASNDSLLAVNATKDTVQVATSGIVDVMVSTVNGNINVGDKVALSPFNGVGMRAVPGSSVIGLAQTGLNASSNDVSTVGVTDKNGKTSQIHVGYIRINIAIGTITATTNQAGLNRLQKWVQSLTGHTVSTARIVLSIVVACVALLAFIVLIYASVFGSIISIGRNPLAQHAVFQTLGFVFGMAALTAAVAIVTIVFLLR